MYEQFYGLKTSPFDLLPKGDLVYLSDSHEEGLAILQYGILSNKGFVVLTGGVGTGKTTLLNALVKLLGEDLHVCLMNNPVLDRDEFYFYLGSKIGLKCEGNKASFLITLSNHLDKLAEKGEKVVIIIDEAQTLNIEMLEEIRLLSNVSETGCMSIFLVGQPELQEHISHPKLLPLRQKIGASYNLKPLTREDTSQYISFRLAMAGAQNTSVFTSRAIELIFQKTSGNPRLINVVCDHAMLEGFSSDNVKIDIDIVKKSVKEALWLDEKRLQMVPRILSIKVAYGSVSRVSFLKETLVISI